VTARPFREMTTSQKTSYVVGALIAAVVGAGVLAILAGLLWRAIVAVWS
jgi:hypothetical protein